MWDQLEHFLDSWRPHKHAGPLFEIVLQNFWLLFAVGLSRHLLTQGAKSIVDSKTWRRHLFDEGLGERAAHAATAIDRGFAKVRGHADINLPRQRNGYGLEAPVASATMERIVAASVNEGERHFRWHGDTFHDLVNR